MFEGMFDDLKSKKKKIGIIGLGYVGLPLALELGRSFSVIGFDINEERVSLMNQKIDPSRELPSSAFDQSDIEFTADVRHLSPASFFIVAVPTPIDRYRVPNLKPLFGASETIGKVIKQGDIVVFESTVYPGCTEEDCLPIIEQLSGLKSGADFGYGYSPERINPGDKERTVRTILKVVSGNSEESSDVIERVYGEVIDAGVHVAPTVKVAEAAKVIENTQRDLNIAFMNELSVIFDRMGIDTLDVLKAAETKWNFLKFRPGLVGGHCIGVDPYYLTYKAQQLGYTPEVILSGRRVNDNMPAFVAKRLIQSLLQRDVPLKGARFLVMGITFKEDVSDIRNSKVATLVKELESYTFDVDVVDPQANADEVMEEYGITLSDQPTGLYEGIILAVAHAEYRSKSLSEIGEFIKSSGVFMDLKAIFDHAPEGIEYWRL